MFHQRKSLLVSMGIAPLLLATMPAGKALAESNLELEEITVSAQGREQTLQDVPVSVSVMSGEFLERSNLTSLESISTRMPNVQITPDPASEQIHVRGVGSGSGSAFEQSVATFVDGVYRSRSRSARAALLDVERVEILKGPQITFFGANAIAGALNITTRKPGNEQEYNFSALHSVEYGEYGLEGGVTMPLSDTFSMRVAGRVSGMDGYIENSVSGDGPNDDSRYGRLSLRWQPTDTLQSDFRIDAGKTDLSGAFASEVTDCPPPAGFPSIGASCQQYLAANGGSIDNSYNYKSEAPSTQANFEFYEAEWVNALDVGDGVLKSITGYYDHSQLIEVQPIPFPLASAVNGYDPFHIFGMEEFNQFSQEIRYESATGGAFEYMVGAYYAETELDVSNMTGFYFLPFGAFTPFTSPTDGVTASNGVMEESRTLSAFASGTWNATDDLRVNFGLRYTNIRKDATRRLAFGTAVDADINTYQPYPDFIQGIFANILVADLDDFKNPRRTDKKLMPSIGVQYDVTDNIMTYASYSNGFKAGGFNGGSINVDFEPEEVDAFEVGLKGKFMDKRLELNTALFFSEYENLQESSIIQNTSGNIATLVGNAAGTETKGIEFGAKMLASSNVVLSADIGYLDSKYVNYPDAPCKTIDSIVDGCSQDMSGKKRPYSPKWSGNIAANITLPLINGLELRIDPLLYFKTKYFQSATADPLYQQPGYSKFDLRLGIGPVDGPWEVALIGKNLTDKATVLSRGGIPLALGTTSVVLDAPRTIAIQFSMRK